MRVELTAKVEVDHTIIIENKMLKPGKFVRVIIDDSPDLAEDNSEIINRQKIISELMSYADETDIITPDGMILREDAYNGR